MNVNPVDHSYSALQAGYVHFTTIQHISHWAHG